MDSSATRMHETVYLNGNYHRNNYLDVKQPYWSKDEFPFVYRYQPTKYEKYRFFFMLVFIFPIRIILAVICLVSAGFIAWLATLGHPDHAQYRLAPWRRVFKWPVIILIRVLFFVCGVHWVSIRGRRVTSHEAPILCMAPHSSYMDVLSGFLCGLPVTVSTKENADTFIVGSLFRVTEAVFINRGDPHSREKCLSEITRRAQSKGEWPQIMTFPEGCCTNRKSLLTFKRGAFEAGVPVQPLLLRYPDHPDNASMLNTGPTEVTLFIVLMCTPHTRLELEFLPVYTPSEQERNDPALYAENVRQMISKHLKIPVSNYTYRDLKQLQKDVPKPRRDILHFIRTLWKENEVVIPSCRS